MSKNKNPWDSGPIIAKGKFKCSYCATMRTGVYRWVDGQRSCEKCNREYDYRAPEVKIRCPVCKGEGYLDQHSCE